MRKALLLIVVLLLATATTIFAQKAKENSVKIEFTKYPTVPVQDFKTLGIQVYTSDMPFNKDTLRYYLNNLDMMMSDAEQSSKIKYKALEDITIVGGEGDVTVEMAFGTPMVVSQELKTSSCMGKKSECTQYYYKVKYYLPAVVQIRKNDQVFGTWDLDPEMELRFGNEQTETRYESKKGTVTSVKVTEYRSEVDLVMAFNSPENGVIVRKAILKHLSQMADVIYTQVFFKDTKMKLAFAYGSGKAADYTETETASENAIAALEVKEYESLNNSISVWENWLEKYEPGNKKAAVNTKLAKRFHENLAIAYAFQTKFDKAKENMVKALELANGKNKNMKEIKRLETLQTSIDEKEKGLIHNGNVDISDMKTAPNIKKQLAKRKLNADLDFLIPKEKYMEIK